MKVFATSDYYRRFVKQLNELNSQMLIGLSEIRRYPNGEIYALIQEDVEYDDCLVIGSTAPPDEQLLSLLTLADALKRHGARRVQALLPYMGYGRQDKFSLGESGGIALIGSMLKTAGIDAVITFDAHSELDEELIGLPLTSLSTAQLFVDAVHELGWKDFTVVAPDHGAIGRAQSLAIAMGNAKPIAYLIKKRSDGIAHLNLVGKVDRHVVIVDDIIDSGQTLLSASSVLRAKGVQEIVIAVSHGLFTGGGWKLLFNHGVKTLMVSDSCPETSVQKHSGLKLLSLNKLLPSVIATALQRIQYER